MTLDNAAQVAARGLRRWRRRAGMTQADLAVACGVSRDTVIRWESPDNRQSPGLTHMLRMCAWLGVTPDHLWRCICSLDSDDGGGSNGPRCA